MGFYATTTYEPDTAANDRRTAYRARRNPAYSRNPLRDPKPHNVISGYRYYSSELGRFVNRDPIGERGGKNIYALVLNSTVNVVDLLGESPMSPLKTRDDVKRDRVKCCDKEKRDKGKQELVDLYNKIYAEFKKKKRPHKSRNPWGGNTCKDLSADVWDYFEKNGIPACWACNLDLRMGKTFIGKTKDHQVVLCVSFDTDLKQVDRIIFDYWANRKAGEDEKVWFIPEYPTNPDHKPEPIPTPCHLNGEEHIYSFSLNKQDEYD